jgi:NTE family protein
MMAPNASELEVERHELNPEAPARAPAQGVALCLSGGGYRAMLFHLGSLWRMNEFGLLKSLKRVSSVSGGSITAAVLGLRWGRLAFDDKQIARAFQEQVVAPVRALARHTIDVGSIVGGLLNPFSTIADSVAAAYRTHLFGDATLQDLPDDQAGPRFILNATNVQTAALWRFSRPYMGDYRVGLIRSPRVALAIAVGASSAFPPYLSPVHVPLDPRAFDPATKGDLQMPPYTETAVLSDGGNYDNLGLEPAFKVYDTVLVSDGGAKVAPEPAPHADWARHSYRMIDVIDNQVRSLRKRTLMAAYLDKSRHGAYWGIRTNIADYQLPSALTAAFPQAQTLKLAEVPTRLAAVDDTLQQRLINWGYAVCDAALRKHYLPADAPPPPGLPYP